MLNVANVFIFAANDEWSDRDPGRLQLKV